jgi:transcriptional regulator with XRE-family HTH domain
VNRNPNPTDVRVGGRIRQARLVIGMTQEALADKLGITFQQVQKYEKGWNRVSASRLEAIAEHVQRPVAWFFEGGGPQGTLPTLGPVAPDPVVELAGTREGVNLARAFNAIADKGQRRALVALAESISAAA